LDVKKMDYRLLHGKVKEIHNSCFGPIIYQHGVIPLARQYDTILMNGDLHSLSTWLLLIYAKLIGHKRIYFWNHGWYGKESIGQALIKRLFYAMAAGIFVYSHYAKNLMIKHGISEDKLYVIHNSLSYTKQLEVRRELENSSVFRDYFKNEGYNLIFVGRLTRVKNLIMLLEILQLDKNKAYHLTFVGDGEMTRELKQQTLQKGLTERVWFYGPCYEEKTLGQLLYNADICIAPGNVGLTAMHAMVYGCPVMTHNNFKWQMPEFEAIKEGVTGCFFQRNNINSLSDQLYKWFVAKREKRDEVRKACMEEIDRNWTPDFQIKVIKEYLKFN
jgi:glycosyltransferase involved in cell wall biosynthesis